MPIALIVGPGAALIGIVAIFFVLRRKSVEKRSMYSARRSQIEHKVRAARQRTLAPHGRAEKPAAVPPPVEQPAPTSFWGPSQATPTVTYQPSAYTPPPAPPNIPPPPTGPPPAPVWEVGPTAPPTPPPFMAPPPAPEPSPQEPFTPAPQPAWEQPPSQPAYSPPAYEPASSEPAWTPAAAPAEPGTPLEPAQPASTVPGGAGWEVVSPAATASVAAPETKKGKKDAAPKGSAWTLASGVTPGAEQDDEPAGKKPSSAVAIAQYAVLVVGLITVLIGVLVMVAESHVT